MENKDTSEKHFYISLIKSGMRFIAAGGLLLGNLILAGSFLALAEVLGVLEEL